MNESELRHLITEKNMEGDPQFRELIEKLRAEFRLGVWQLPTSGIYMVEIPAEEMDHKYGLSVIPNDDLMLYHERPTFQHMFEPYNVEKPLPLPLEIPFTLDIHVAMAIAWCGGSESYCLGGFFNPKLAQDAIAKAVENQKADSQGFELKVFTVKLGKMYKMWENPENPE